MRNFLTLAVAMLAAAVLPGNAQITRGSDAAPSAPLSSQAGVPIPRGFNKFVRPAAHVQQAAIGRRLQPMEFSAPTPPARGNRGALRAPMTKATVKASSLHGYLTYSESVAQSRGWYSVRWPNPTMIWANPTTSQRNYTCGFMRGDDLYAFYTYRTTTSLQAAGLCRLDPVSGSVLEEKSFDIFAGYSCVVTDAAYDPVNDLVYVVTYNDAGTSFIFQTYNPNSGIFTPLGLNFGNEDSVDLPMAMAWSPADNAPYILTFGKEMKRYDAAARKFNRTGASTYDFGEYAGAMTYSPKDAAFVGLFTGYEDDDDYDYGYGYEAPARAQAASYSGECCDVLLISTTGYTSYVSTMTYDSQWSILETGDVYTAPGAPGAVTLSSNFVDAATDGTLSVALPAAAADGSAISGRIYLQVKVDGEALAGAAPSGTPGSTVSVSLSLTEGTHTISVTPYVLGDDGFIYGNAATLTQFFGYDTPAAPAQVSLTSNKVTWSAVTTGANGGYINPADVRYNVFIDGVAMNTAPVQGTSLDITLPATGGISHKATVVAVVNGKTSAEGVSSPLYVSGVLSLPVYIAPEQGETELAPAVRNMFTIVANPAVTSSAQHWQYDLQDPHTGGFYCLNPTTPAGAANSDEWLFLPAISFSDASAYYRLEMEVWAANHYFSSDETYEVALCTAPNGNAPVIIRQADTVSKAPDFQTSETIFQVPAAGTYYIGIHYITPVSDGFRLYARRFRVEKAQATADAPAMVTGLSAQACPQGELAANVTFTLPLLDISGNPLDAAADISAKVATEAGEVSVTGKPGARLTAKVPALQGNNTVKVTTSSASGVGQIAETTVYCGVYAPGTPQLTSVISADNKALTINWTLDEYNDNEEYVGPDQCTYTVYRHISDSDWAVVASGIKGNSWSYTATNASQDIYQFGVAATNAAGTSETMNSVGAILGTPYPIPFHETFPLNGDYIDMKEPIMIENLSYLGGMWNFVEPTDLDDNASNESGVALSCQGVTISQLTLPKFSTIGAHNVKFELSLWFSERSASFVNVYASSPDKSMVQVAEFTPADGNGWEKKVIDLPADFQNKSWISLTIRVNIENYSQFFMMDGYGLTDYPAEMMSIDALEGPARLTVGREAVYSATVRNLGTTPGTAPACSMEITTPDGVQQLPAQISQTDILPSATAEYTFKFTPKDADTGKGMVKFAILGQPAAAVSEISKEIKVVNAPLPVVGDLAATVNPLDVSKGDVSLSWSEPQYVQGFENAQPWSYDSELEGFLNSDLDGSRTYAITELSYPGKFAPKAFQVFNSEGTDASIFGAHSGDQYAVGLASSGNGLTNDWLISPVVKGGSKVSFWYNLLSSQYPATVKVMWSDGSTNTLDFDLVDNGALQISETGWKQFSVTLPAQAKRFALWHDGPAGEELFGFMLDDIAYDPAEPEVPYTGYNLYRDGQLIASGLTTTGYLDPAVDLAVPVQYIVKTTGTVAGQTVESSRSNVLWVDINGSGIGDITTDGIRSIRGLKGAIELRGFDAGYTVRVINAAGATTIRTGTSGDVTTIPCAPGLYIVECGNSRAKISVR